ncbi:OBG GTPase family GTP-binding protein [Methanomassiliicoccus luminyensis]|uniref:OBG GTPase family GTP-binding protein n=1 Tax=Methanomassiliicoccus luminyensis TaxID=1080712 RepID=UPI00035EF944|nr:GTP-binding protein [Methanomassiliicoccus luminyensis]
MALTIDEQIKAIEDEILKTQKNKKTEGHIGLLKAKIARLKMEQEKRRAASGGGGQGYSVKKSGNATVALVGFPSVGKSTLLNKLTDAKSDVAAYAFTTLDVIPGILYHKYAKIQILDMPGLIRDASKGKGRGREVLAVVRTSDLVMFVIDVYETNIDVLAAELYNTGIRLNTRPPNVVITKTDKGGIEVKPTVTLTKITSEMAADMVGAYGYVNAEVIIREDVDEEQLIDALTGNRVYLKAMAVVNKIDLADEKLVANVKKKLAGWNPVFVSANKMMHIDDLKEAIYRKLDFIHVFLKPQGQDADMDEPMVIMNGSTVGDLADRIHRAFRKNFRYAIVWGKSAKFPGQTVGVDHVLMDGDIVTVVVKRGGE